MEDIIINLEKNNIFITNSTHIPALRACMNFEKVIDIQNPTEIGLMPIFTIYVHNFQDTEECKRNYKDYRKQLLNLLCTFPSFRDVYYIDYFNSDKIMCLKEAMLESSDITKVPMETTLQLYKEAP
jgi:hypothetical protein